MRLALHHGRQTRLQPVILDRTILTATTTRCLEVWQSVAQVPQLKSLSEALGSSALLVLYLIFSVHMKALGKYVLRSP